MPSPSQRRQRIADEESLSSAPSGAGDGALGDDGADNDVDKSGGEVDGT